MQKLLDHHLTLRFILAIGLLFLGTILVSCSPTTPPEAQVTISTLRVVMDNNYPPYVFQDDQGHLQGILIDQWTLWAKRTGVKVEITALPWGEALERMKAGEFDVIDTIFYRSDRAKDFDFTGPYAQINVRIFFQNNISGIAKAEDLKGFRIAAKSGDANADYLLERGVKDLIYYPSYEAILQAAKRKDVNIFVMDQPPAFYFLYKYGLQDQYNFSEALDGNAFHRAVSKGNTQILKLVESGFSKITQSEYKSIDEHWLGTGQNNNLQQIMPYLAIGVAIAALIILVLFTFNRMLQSRVQTRTLELQDALNDLQKSETRFREAIEFFPVPVGIANTEGKILSLNRKFIDIYGYSLDDIPSVDDWLFRAYPDDEYRSKVQAQWNEDVDAAVKSKASTPLREYKVTCKDGSQCNVDIVMHPIGDLWVASFNDVTAHKQAEDELRENRRFLADLIEYSGALIFVKDRDGCYELINRKWEEVTGLKREGVIGNTDEALFPGSNGSQFRANDLEVMETGHVIEREEILDGEKKRYFISVKFPVRDESGNVKGVSGMITEITDRKRAEEALRESEENYRNLVELSPDAIMVHCDGKVVFVNSAGLHLIHARDTSEVIGLPAINFVHPDQRNMITERIRQMQVRGEKAPLLEEKFVCLDGTLIDVEVVAMPVHYEGRPATQVVIRDITERKHSIEIMHQSERRFRTLIENSADALTLLNADGSVFYEGPTVKRLTGFSATERLGMSSFDNVFPADLPRLKETMANLMNSPSVPFTLEFRSIRKDGSIWWTEATATNLLHDTSVQAIVVNYRDITERKQAEDALRKSDERNRAIVDALPDLLFEISIDGRFLDCIGSEPGRLLVPRDLAIGRRVSELLPANVAAKTMEKIQQTLSENRMCFFDYSLEVNNKMQYYESRMTPLGSDSVLALVRNITEEKQIEQALRKSEQRYRTLFDRANDAIFVETLDDQILDANERACQMLGYTRNELIHMKVSDVIFPEIRRKLPAIRNEFSEFGRKPFESLDVRKDGTIINVEVTNSALPDNLALSIVRDITERKQAEDALRKSEAEVRNLNIELEKRVEERTAQLEITNKELEAFSYSVSHDLRAPLRAIDGFSRIILEDHASQLDQEVRNLLQHVCAESQHMAQLIDSLLNLSRMSRAEMHKEIVDLSALARHVLNGLRQSQPHRQVECVVGENIIAQGDARLLNVVFENLLGNAWKFTSKNETAIIEFGAVQRENELAYFVRDNGAGFDPAYAAKLFGAFQRLHRTDEFEGTGIGLATVQRVIRRHGGRVWAESELEKGATFYFTLG